MKSARALTIALGLAVLAAAVGTAFADPPKAPPPAAANNPAPADVARFLAFFDKVIDAAVVNKDSCPKMATAVNAVIDDNQPVLAMAKDAKAKGKTLPQDAKDHIMAGSKRLIPAIQSCSKDQIVLAAFQRLDMK